MTSSTFRQLLSDTSKNAVAIIGGGVTGAAVAYHLAKDEKAGSPEIIIFEPRETIGRGLAYDTSDPVHRINVPATRMSILPDDPDHFARWISSTDALARDAEAARPDGNLFPRRSTFGDYVFSNLAPLLDAGVIRHLRSAVAKVEKKGACWQVTSDDGDIVLADILVIATTHPAPVPPARLAKSLGGHPRFIEDPTVSNALAPIREDDRVLVVGNGLTSADVIASLKQRGHRGEVIAISRRGLRSRGHAPCPHEPFGDFLSSPETRASRLVARIRKTIHAATEDGLTWHAVLDQLRAQGSALWSYLPVSERRRIVRHLRPYWDVHRFRIAPQVEDVLDFEVAAGRLEILAASIDHVATEGDIIQVLIKRRGHEQPEKREFDAVVVTTGPAHGRLLSSQGWLDRLGKEGHLHIDPTGLGLACNEQAQALRTDGTADPSLFIAGPLARGQFGELMGFPQVPEHAVFVAKLIAEDLRQRRSAIQGNEA